MRQSTRCRNVAAVQTSSVNSVHEMIYIVKPAAPEICAPQFSPIRKPHIVGKFPMARKSAPTNESSAKRPFATAALIRCAMAPPRSVQSMTTPTGSTAISRTIGHVKISKASKPFPPKFFFHYRIIFITIQKLHEKQANADFACLFHEFVYQPRMFHVKHFNFFPLPFLKLCGCSRAPPADQEGSRRKR